MLNFTTGLTNPPVVPIDPRYGNELAFQGRTPLDQRSLLATATDTLGKLALKDFYGQIGSFKSTPVPGFSSVSIKFQVFPPAQQVETRIAVWAVYNLVLNIALTGRYQQTGFRIYWNRVQIATLRIAHRVSSQATLEQRSGSFLNATDDLPYLQSPANISATWTEDYPGTTNTTNMLSVGDLFTDCLYQDDAEELGVSEILGAVLAGLKNVAVVPKTDRMDGILKIYTQGIESKVLFVGNDVDPDHPTYQYQSVIGTLRAMPTWLLSQGRLAEMLCYIVVDRQYVGGGFLEKLSRPD
ncbi:hypothetical protein MMC28_009511 [Mycoblastus sanguinarius]|nr:hypothetical protein [Mycoblastus sanguinarius]